MSGGYFITVGYAGHDGADRLVKADVLDQGPPDIAVGNHPQELLIVSGDQQDLHGIRVHELDPFDQRKIGLYQDLFEMSVRHAMHPG